MEQPDPKETPERGNAPEDNWMNSREAAKEFGVDLDDDEEDEDE